MPSIARPGRTHRVVSVGRWRHIGSHRSSQTARAVSSSVVVAPVARSRLLILFRRRHLFVAPHRRPCWNIARHSSTTPTAAFTATNTRRKATAFTHNSSGSPNVVGGLSVSRDCKLTLPSTMVTRFRQNYCGGRVIASRRSATPSCRAVDNKPDGPPVRPFTAAMEIERHDCGQSLSMTDGLHGESASSSRDRRATAHRSIRSNTRHERNTNADHAGDHTRSAKVWC